MTECPQCGYEDWDDEDYDPEAWARWCAERGIVLQTIDLHRDTYKVALFTSEPS